MNLEKERLGSGEEVYIGMEVLGWDLSPKISSGLSMTEALSGDT